MVEPHALIKPTKQAIEISRERAVRRALLQLTCIQPAKRATESGLGRAGASPGNDRSDPFGRSHRLMKAPRHHRSNLAPGSIEPMWIGARTRAIRPPDVSLPYGLPMCPSSNGMDFGDLACPQSP